MKLSQELRELERLRWNGTLTEQEFAQAKAVLLGQPSSTGVDEPRCTLAELEAAWVAARQQYCLPTLSDDEEVEPSDETVRHICSETRVTAGIIVLVAVLVMVAGGTYFEFADGGLYALLAGGLSLGAAWFIGVHGVELAKRHAVNAEKLRQGWAVYHERRAQILQRLQGRQ